MTNNKIEEIYELYKREVKVSKKAIALVEKCLNLLKEAQKQREKDFDDIFKCIEELENFMGMDFWHASQNEWKNEAHMQLDIQNNFDILYKEIKKIKERKC